MLLENPDFLVTQLTAAKPFAFEPFFMRTKYRFIEGYRGNDTVRGWREFDSIYHAVFADMRGSRGYPKGDPYNIVPQGLLLRPAIPNDEIFGADGTYGPKANFKISLRELPDDGRFRVTVTAAKYNDGLLLDPGTPRADHERHRCGKTRRPPAQHHDSAGRRLPGRCLRARTTVPPPDSSRLADGTGRLVARGHGARPAILEGNAKLVDSPVGKAVSLSGSDDAFSRPAQRAAHQ